MSNEVSKDVGQIIEQTSADIKAAEESLTTQISGESDPEKKAELEEKLEAVAEMEKEQAKDAAALLEIVQPVAPPVQPAPPEGPSVHDDEQAQVSSAPAVEVVEGPEHPIGSLEIAKANGLSDLAATAYVSHFAKLRQNGVPELTAHIAAAQKTDGELQFRAVSVLRNDETHVLPGDLVTHCSDAELCDLLSRGAIELV